MNTCYVYQLIDPRDNTPFYVGEGKGNRAWSHLSFRSGCNNPHKDRVIRKIQSLGLTVIVDIIKENLSKAESVQHEEQLIEEIGLDKLTNICANANPPVLKGDMNGFYGKPHSEETKKKLGNINRGRDLKTQEGKDAISKSMIERWNDPAQRFKQIELLKNRRGEKRSDKAKESYKKSAAIRDANMTSEQRSERTRKGVETKKIKYAGQKRQAYVDELGNKRFRYVPDTA